MDEGSRINILSVCAGVGGLDLGVHAGMCGAGRTVCYVEREAFAAAILVARMEDKNLDDAPVWSDLRTFDGRPWRGIVDCIIGGYPCQPFSFAGKRGGESDPRHLWPEISRLIGEIEPSIVFFENVAGHLTLGFDAVRADLTARGFRVAAGLFTAQEVGAPHKRERLFILGVADGAGRGRGELRESSGGDGLAQCGGGGLANTNGEHDRFAAAGGIRSSGRLVAGSGEQVADTRSERPQGLSGRGPAARPVGRGDGALGNTGSESRRGNGVDEAESLAGTQDRISWQAGRNAFGVSPPGPGDRAAWQRILAERPDLAPAISAPAKSSLRGMVDGLAYGTHNAIECGHEQVDGKKDGSATNTGSQMSGVRKNRRKTRKAPQGLQQASGRGGAVSKVPSQGGPAGRVCTKGESERAAIMLDVQSHIYTKPKSERGSVWFRGMQERLRKSLCEEEVGEKKHNTILHNLWKEVYLREDERQDVLADMWVQVSVDEKAGANRLDRLRALGNGVVPQTAELAFVTLWACLMEGKDAAP